MQVRPRRWFGRPARNFVGQYPGDDRSDYRGEIKVILVNLSNEDFELKPGERIAQLVVARFTRIAWGER